MSDTHVGCRAVPCRRCLSWITGRGPPRWSTTTASCSSSGATTRPPPRPRPGAPSRRRANSPSRPRPPPQGEGGGAAATDVRGAVTCAGVAVLRVPVDRGRRAGRSQQPATLDGKPPCPLACLSACLPPVRTRASRLARWLRGKAAHGPPTARHRNNGSSTQFVTEERGVGGAGAPVDEECARAGRSVRSVFGMKIKSGRWRAANYIHRAVPCRAVSG